MLVVVVAVLVAVGGGWQWCGQWTWGDFPRVSDYLAVLQYKNTK
jgi:hypothetical protein